MLRFEPAIIDVYADYGTDCGSDSGRDHTYCQHSKNAQHSQHLLSFGVLPDESRSIGDIISENFPTKNPLRIAGKIFAT